VSAVTPLPDEPPDLGVGPPASWPALAGGAVSLLGLLLLGCGLLLALAAAEGQQAPLDLWLLLLVAGPAVSIGGLALRRFGQRVTARAEAGAERRFRDRPAAPAAPTGRPAAAWRRRLPVLAVVLLAVAALLGWRFWPSSRVEEGGSPLDDLPHVASLEGDAGGRPERVVVHLRDWHLVPRDAFDKDVKAAVGRDLSKEELDRLYAEHLDAVESVQKQLDAVIRQLAARRHELPVYVEGLTDDGVNVYRLKATAWLTWAPARSPRPAAPSTRRRS
jgi:hypothetical protein